MMKLYKYREFSDPDAESYERLSTILRQASFWCAKPESLNDPVEFRWTCDYTSTSATTSLLAQLLVKYRHKGRSDANAVAAAAVQAGRLEALTVPIVKQIIDQCRSDIGLACFGTSKAGEVMWERYGGAGAGVCVEIEVPSELLHKQLFPVSYSDDKSLHVDQLLRSVVDTSVVGEIYQVALLSKPTAWAPEEEVRFVSKQQNVSVRINGSRISSLILGPSLSQEVLCRIRGIVESLPYDLPLPNFIDSRSPSYPHDNAFGQ